MRSKSVYAACKKGKAGGADVVAIDLPTKQPQTNHAPPSVGFFIAYCRPLL